MKGFRYRDRLLPNGGIENELRDPLIKPLSLDATERADLVEFMRSLTGDNITQLVEEAEQVPVGDTRAALSVQHH